MKNESKVFSIRLNELEEVMVVKKMVSMMSRDNQIYKPVDAIKEMIQEWANNVSSEKADTDIKSNTKSDTELIEPVDKTTTKDLFEEVLLNIDTPDKKTDRESFSIGGESINI